jgi:hypothetical protein
MTLDILPKTWYQFEQEWSIQCAGIILIKTRYIIMKYVLKRTDWLQCRPTR